MMYLYVVRHGETDENKDHIMQGHLDTLLNKKGIKQAKNVRKAIIKEKIDLIISSPLKRCLDTAKIISKDKIPILIDERLISRNHGEFQGLSRYDINLEDYWNYYKNTKYEKAESVRDLYDRVASLIEDVKKQNKNVLLVTHSGVCRILYYYFNGIPEDGGLLEYESKNCLFEKYELEDEV